jgi:hypothetical protein
MKWQVSLNDDSFDRAGITKDCKDALCEYIWNGFEAEATQVTVSIFENPLKESMYLKIIDNGTGIPYENLKDTFGAFLSSLKNDSSIRLKSQINKGKGRFSYLCFAPLAEWTTIYRKDNKLYKYDISTLSTNRSEFQTTEPILVDDTECTGTSVFLPITDANTLELLSYTNMRLKLLEEFAWFLYLNKQKGIVLEYAGNILDESQYISTDLCGNYTIDVQNTDFHINIIVWKNCVSNASKIFYLMENGEIIHVQNTTFNKNTVGFYHAVFVSSSFFRSDMFFSLSDEEDLYEHAVQEEDRIILRELKKRVIFGITETFKAFLILNADKQLAEMEERGNMPRFSDDEYGALRKKDFETVTRELYYVEPKIFYRLNDTQEKSLLGFLNLLLSSEERENVLLIIEQVVSLTPEQRSSFVEVLRISQLQYIIDAIGLATLNRTEKIRSW